ncbi:membrane protein YqaA with SNARE-associated domain [Ruegeria conchae]|uniref:Membrane protein YqaA with SNARE-associated domain n=2 Tax=Ruegeria conchae TaxID=981384 RepID=A0A497ZMQ7_9RHOB|nr:membrane protein YqaA with SNARE-associated domain [Ruegeria conchae]
MRRKVQRQKTTRASIVSATEVDGQAGAWFALQQQLSGQQFFMLRPLYDWTLRLAEHPHALWALAIVAFVESSFFPIPPDVLMIPMIIARPSRAWLIATVALVASVLGGMLGYAIGAFFYESLGQPILEAMGKAHAMEEFNTRFNDFGFWAVLAAGVTPFPYKVITIMSGWTGMPLGTFIATSILARALRFFLVAGLLWKFGEPIRDFIEKRLGLMFTLFIVLLFGGFLIVKYL